MITKKFITNANFFQITLSYLVGGRIEKDR